MFAPTLVKIVLILLGVGLLGFGVMQPKPGHGSWITSLAGDWSIDIKDGFVIGNDPMRSGNFVVYKITEAESVLRRQIEGAWFFALDKKYCIVKATNGLYYWREIGDDDVWKKEDRLPHEVAYLEKQLAIPTRSRRLESFLLGGFSILLGICLLSFGKKGIE
ncbi:MAG: hypothetical protein AB7N71_05835 [Phycisphaerae bacterium]